ncbi:AAA family ATPase [Acidobacteriota bacterium]
MSNIEKIKSEIDLKKYLETNEGYVFKGNMTTCPFHEDRHPSMSVDRKQGSWLWYCHACKEGGDIFKYLEKKHGQSINESIDKLCTEFNFNNNFALRTEYIYRVDSGDEIFKIIKIKTSDGNKNYPIYHKENDSWILGKGNHEWIPYTLNRFKDFRRVIICEGEKDADTINELETEFLATSAPCGQGSWDKCLTKYFENFLAIVFLYDVGGEKNVEKHALLLKTSFPEKEISIASVPMKNREDDVSDYLKYFDDKETKKTKLIEIIRNSKPYHLGQILEEKGNDNIFVGTLEDLRISQIPETENLVEPYVFRGGLTEIGGVKGSHKSFFVTQMALFYAGGISPFLTGTIEKPGKVMLIQQEISLGYLKKRLEKMSMSQVFETKKRFFPITTTGQQLKILNNKDYDQIKKWIEQIEPDILILDPLSSFNTSEENMSKDMSKIISRLSEIKSNYNLGLVITHHFSSKRSPGDPSAPVEAGGWFRGHSVLSDAADVLICLHRLPGQRENPNLPKPYEAYNQVEISLRNDRPPPKFSTEFDDFTFLLQKSEIMRDVGKIILPGQIEELLRANDGEMMQKDVISYFKQTASPVTVKRAIREATRIKKETIEGRGSPVLLKLIG